MDKDAEISAHLPEWVVILKESIERHNKRKQISEKQAAAKVFSF